MFLLVLIKQATQELSKLENASQRDDMDSSNALRLPFVDELVADSELDEYNRELESLRQERLRLMKRVQSLDREI